MTYLIRLIICLSCLISYSAWAGRPFFTDDAVLTTAKTCQVESWMQLNANHDRDFLALPACNPTGNFEMTAGVNQLQTRGDDNLTTYLIQGKTLFRELKTNSWGVGLAFGANRRKHGDAATDFIYLPYSVSFADDAVLVHANLGWSRTRIADDAQTTRFNRTTWGLGAEYSLIQHVSVFAEAFGDDVVRPILHTGLNISLVPNKLNLNITGGRDLAVDADHNFYSVGLNFYGLQ